MLDDDPVVVAAVESALHAEVRARRPLLVKVVRIDGWFSRRWLQFSGKALGALRCTSARLVIPPFVPNRAVEESHAAWDETTQSYAADATAPPLHVVQRSAANHGRSLAALGGSCVALWLGVSVRDGRASAMLYAVGPPAADAWYVSLVRRKDSWDVDFSNPLSASESRELLGLCD